MTRSSAVSRPVNFGGTTMPCRVSLPPGHDGRTPLPALLFLHGSGERGADGVRQTKVGLGRALSRHPERFPAVVVMPQAPFDRFWAGAPAEAALEALRQVRAEFPIDSDRLYLSGMSMGGHGAWYLAYRHPELFAAVAPVCGWVAPSGIEPPGTVSVVPEAQGEPYAAVARRLAGVPIWIFHGDDDPIVPVDGSRRAAAALRAAGGVVNYTEYHGAGHNAWDDAYGSLALATWLFAQRRGQPGLGLTSSGI